MHTGKQLGSASAEIASMVVSAAV